MNKNKTSMTAFTCYGPFIGTWIIVLSFHSLIFLDHPARFLVGLVTPSIIIPMVLLMCIAMIMGYMIGFIPAYITGQLFAVLFQHKLANANLFKATVYGCVLGLLWAPVLGIFLLFSQQQLLPFLYLQFIFIVPITIICTLIEWKKLAPH